MPGLPIATLAFLLLITSACVKPLVICLLPDNHRRAGKAIARKHRRRARADGGIDDGQIERAVFDPDVFGEREKPFGVVEIIWLSMLHD